MTRAIMLLLAGALLGPAAVRAADDCQAARCAAEAAVNARCSCDAAVNHGQYVHCVARAVREIGVPPACRRDVVRCAARSRCGKAGAVSCRRPVGACDAATDTCERDPAVSCATALDCGSRCRVASSAERCTSAGGVVGTGPSCCAACP
jgi:hypothetical protein